MSDLDHLEDDDSQGTLFREWRKAKQAKRAANRENGQKMLTKAGISFTTHNEGAHLILETTKGRIDYYPGTGLWVIRDKHLKGRGIRKLFKYIEQAGYGKI